MPKHTYSETGESRVNVSGIDCVQEGFDSIDFEVSLSFADQGLSISRKVRGTASRVRMTPLFELTFHEESEASIIEVAEAAEVEMYHLLIQLRGTVYSHLMEQDSFRSETHGLVTVSVIDISSVGSEMTALWSFLLPGGRYVMCPFPILSTHEDPERTRSIEAAVQWILRTEESFPAALPGLYRAVQAEGKRLRMAKRRTKTNDGKTAKSGQRRVR